MNKTLTPPTEKWLLNELAAARGDLLKIERDLVIAKTATERLEVCLCQQQA